MKKYICLCLVFLFAFLMIIPVFATETTESPKIYEIDINAVINGKTDCETGYLAEYISGLNNTLTTEFCSYEKYFAAHPEYFALHNGKRDSRQLCLMNNDVYDIVLSELLALLKEKHDPGVSLQIISLIQNDAGEDAIFCECENCKTADEENDSHSGTIITFVNRIAEALAEKGYDNIAVETCVSGYTVTVPCKVKPRENVIVRLSAADCCYSHIIPDTSCAQNERFMEELKAWGKICDKLHVWYYADNFACPSGIFPDFGVLQRNIITLYEHKVRGIYVNTAEKNDNAGFNEMKEVLVSKLLRDPYCDFYGSMDEFLESYYGDGWQNIREFIDMLVISASKGHLEIFSDMKKSLHFTYEEIKKCDALWENAKKECKNEAQLEHIRASELSWKNRKASVGIDEEPEGLVVIAVFALCLSAAAIILQSKKLKVKS